MTLTNYYKIPAAKGIVKNEPDIQIKKTGIKMDSMVVIAGATGSGKTNSLLQFIEESSGAYYHIYVLHMFDEEIYDILTKCVGKENITFFKDVNAFPDVRCFDDQRKEKKKFHSIIIFDDCINVFGEKYLAKIKDYYTTGRKKKLTCIYLSQSYFDTPELIRKQLHYLILCSIKNKGDLGRILQEQSFDIDKETFSKVYFDCMEKEEPDELPFLKIQCGTCPLNHRVSRGLTDYYIFKS